MHPTVLLTVALAVLSNALPQAGPPSPGKGGVGAKGPPPAKGGKGGAGGKVNTSALMGGINNLLKGKQPGTDGPDLRGIAEFLKDPSIPTMLGGALSFLGPLFKIPDIQKFGASYLDFRNISQLPFVVKMPHGPVPPPGCSQYEMIIGKFPLCNWFRCSNQS
jgi:hypothetical protein